MSHLFLGQRRASVVASDIGYHPAKLTSAFKSSGGVSSSGGGLAWVVKDHWNCNVVYCTSYIGAVERDEMVRVLG